VATKILRNKTGSDFGGPASAREDEASSLVKSPALDLGRLVHHGGTWVPVRSRKGANWT
jgi:hypothetical protein